MSSGNSAGYDEQRKEMLGYLSSMGVLYPPSTKLPLDVLRDRFATALDRTQRRLEVLGRSKTVDLESLKPWRGDLELTKRVNKPTHREMEEGPKGGLFQPFVELRVNFTRIAKDYETRPDATYFLRASKEECFAMKITCVYEVQEEHVFASAIPLFKVDYSDDSERILHELETASKCYLYPSGRGAYVMLRKLLEMNASHAKQYGWKPSRPGWISSFYLPINSLSLKDKGSLMKDIGCWMCGKPSRNRCSRCQSISYCGETCQRSDWKRHKPSCRPLDTGTWITINYMHKWYPDMDDIIVFRPYDGANSNPAEIHGTSPFVVKIVQEDLVGVQGIAAYDRQQSIRGIIVPRDNPNYLLLAAVVGTVRLDLPLFVSDVRTTYRWAKYLGDGKLSICFDRMPDQSLLFW